MFFFLSGSKDTYGWVVLVLNLSDIGCQGRKNNALQKLAWGGGGAQVQCSQWDNFQRKRNLKERFGPSDLTEGKGKRQKSTLIKGTSFDTDSLPLNPSSVTYHLVTLLS